MYKGVKMFPKPIGKVYYRHYDDFHRLEIVFTKRDIYIYHFNHYTYLVIYNVDYDINDIVLWNMCILMNQALEKMPRTIFGKKFYEYIRDYYNQNYNEIHGYNLRIIDDPLRIQSDIKTIQDYEDYFNQYYKTSFDLLTYVED